MPSQTDLQAAGAFVIPAAGSRAPSRPLFRAVSSFESLTFRMAHLSTRSKIMAGTKSRKEDEVGSDSAGQSGDIQQMPNAAEADSESVEELVEEGNAAEAEAVEGVEDASDPDVSEVTTRDVPEDDVPSEYQEDEDVA